MSEEAQRAANHGKPAAAEEAALPHSHDCAALHDVSTEVSNTNITQMTGGQPPASEAGKWRCEACTYENYPLSRKCTMCRSPKPAMNEDIFKLQDGASALPAPQEPCGAEAIAERLKPLRISSPQEQSSSCGVHKWSCATCTYENWPRSARCAMCGAPPPPPPPPAAAAPPPPPPAAAPAAPHTPIHLATRNSKQCIGINEISIGEHALISPTESETRRSKRAHNAVDWIWLQACLGVVEGSARCVEEYLASGGDPARALSAAEVALLHRPSAFDVGHTLVHLAIRFQRQEILTTLLSRISGGGPGLKRSPSYIAPDLAAAIRRHLAACVRYKKGTFPCRYINEFPAFSLPREIEELPGAIREQLFSEVLDREAQRTLESERLVNWCGEASRLHALWNRSAGDCLPDAVCQAACGVFDRHNTLRAALADTLQTAHRALYARWAAWERAQAARLHYAPDEPQLRAEWARLLAAAPAVGTPLHQLHVFVLAHVMRRPLIVYGVDVVHSFRGEPLGYARFRGIYLPLLWEPGFCSKSPLCLGYTRGHFSALVPMERYGGGGGGGGEDTLVPLTDARGKLLPVQFATAEEAGGAGAAEALVRRWTRAVEALEAPARGALLARAPAHPRPLLQAQMLEEWLNHYRRLAQQTRGPFPPRLLPAGEYCSEPDTDEE